MRNTVVLVLVASLLALFGAQANALIVDSDIGNPALAGRSAWDIDNGFMDITAGGNDIWNNSDQMHFYSQAFDALAAIDIVVRAEGFTGGTNTWRKQGVMIRDTLDGNSANAFTLVSAGGDSPDHYVRQQWRYNAGEISYSDGPRGTPQAIDPPPGLITGEDAAPQWLRIVRDAVSPEDYDNQVAQPIHYYYADAYDTVAQAVLPMPGTATKIIQVPRDIDGIPGQDFTDPDGIPGSGDEILLWDDQEVDANPWQELLGTTYTTIDPDGVPASGDEILTWDNVIQSLHLQGDAEGKIYAGLAVTSHNVAELTTARFSNILGIELPDVYKWYGGDLDPGTYPGGVGEWTDVNAWTAQSSSGGEVSYPQGIADVQILDLGGPIIRNAETVRTIEFLGAATQLTFDETGGVAGSLTVQGPFNAAAAQIFVKASGASLNVVSGAIGGLVLDKGDGSDVDFSLDAAGPMSITNLAGKGRLTFQGGGTLTLTDDISDLDNRPIKAEGIGFTVDNATLVYRNASNSIVDGFGTPFPLGGSTGEIILNSGTLSVIGATGEFPDMLAHYGWNHITENQMHYLDGSTGQNLMTMTPDAMGIPLTTGPANRGLDFNNDADFQATGAITVVDNYMNLFLGKIVVTQADIDANADAGAAFTFQVAGDDDRSGMWLDLNNNGVFDAAEQLLWEDTTAKPVTFSAPGSYMFAATHGEFGGGSAIDVRFQAPGMGAVTVIKPSAQPGRWIGIGPEAVMVTNDVTVSGNSAFNFSSFGTPSLAYVALNDGANLALKSVSGAIDVETFGVPDAGGSVGVTANSTVNLAYYDDSNATAPVTFTKTGAGTLVVNNEGGLNSGDNTTLVAGAGRLQLTQAAADTFSNVQLDGGELYLAGDLIPKGAPEVLPGYLAHYGYNINNDALLRVNGNTNLMLTNPTSIGLPDPSKLVTVPSGIAILVNGPGDRGLNFDNDADFMNTGAVSVGDNYMNMFIGYLNVDAAHAGVWSFKDNQDDDIGSFWLDLDQDGVFESTGDNQGENLIWETGTVRMPTLAAGQYMIAAMHREGTGGSGIDIQVQAPGMAALESIKPSAASQAGMWSGLVSLDKYAAADFAVTDFEVVSNSTLQIGSETDTSVGHVTLTDGLLTVNAKGLLYQSAPKVNLAGTTLGAGGYETLVDVNAGALDTTGPGAVFTKLGAATLDITAANADGADNLAGAAMRVEEGVMRVLKPTAVGQAELRVGSLDTYNSGIPQLLLSRDAGGGVYNSNVVFDGGDDSYRAITEQFFNGNATDAAINPIQTGLMADTTPQYFGALLGPILYSNSNGTSTNFVTYTGGAVNADTVSGLWVGQLAIGGDSPSAGYVGFATRSDDGSTLWVDLDDNGTFESNELVVSNLGAHGEQNRFGSVNLTPGEEYMFAIGWYDSGGGDYIAARFTTNSALALNDANYGSMIVINPTDAANGQDKLFVGNVFARQNSTLLTIGDMAGSTAGPVSLNGMTVESGKATVDIKSGYSLNVTGGLTTSGVGDLTIQGGAMTIAATPLVNLEGLHIVSGASLAGLQSLTVASALQMQGAGASLTFAAPNVLTSVGATIDVTDGAILTNDAALVAANLNVLTGSTYNDDGNPLTLTGGLAVTGGSTITNYGSVSVDSYLTLQNAAASMTFAAPKTLTTSANTTVSVTDGAILTNDVNLATMNFEVLNDSKYVITGTRKDINISGNMTVRNSSIENYGSIQVAGNLTLDGPGAQLSFDSTQGTFLQTTPTTMVILRNQASLTVGTALHSDGLQILSGANFIRNGDLIADPTSRDVWISSILTLDGASLDMVNNGPGMPPSTLHLTGAPLVTIGTGQTLRIKDRFEVSGLNIYGTLDLVGADKSITVHDQGLTIGTGNVLDMSASALSVGSDSVITVAPNAALIVGGGALLNAGDGLQNIGGLDLQGALIRMGDPSSEADFNVGVTKTLKIGSGQVLDQRGFLLATGPNTVIGVGAGGMLAGDQPLQGTTLDVNGGTIEVPSLTMSGQMTLTKATINGSISGTGGMLVIDDRHGSVSRITGTDNHWSGVTQIDRGLLEMPDLGNFPAESTINMSGEWDQMPSGLQGAGTFARYMGNGAGQIYWSGSTGFAAKGGPLAVTLNDSAPIVWGRNGFGGSSSADYMVVMGSFTADDVVTLTNDLSSGTRDLNLAVFDNHDSPNDSFAMTGSLQINNRKIEKWGDGLLQVTNPSNNIREIHLRQGAVYLGTNFEGLNRGAKLWLEHDGGRSLSGEYGATLLGNGVFEYPIGNLGGSGGATGGGMFFQGNAGFGARGGDLTITLRPGGLAGTLGAPLIWSDGNNGFNGKEIFLGSQHATDMVTLTNDIVLNNGSKKFHTFDNPFTDQDVAKLTGRISNKGFNPDGTPIASADAWVLYMDNYVGPGAGTLWIDGQVYLGTHADSRIHIEGGVLRAEASKMESWNTRLEFNADHFEVPAIWEGWGTTTMKTDDNDRRSMRFEQRGGGFACWGPNPVGPDANSFVLSIGGGGELRWSDRDTAGTIAGGFQGRPLQLGSATANGIVQITNNIDLRGGELGTEDQYENASDWGYRVIRLRDNPFEEYDRAILSGVIMDNYGRFGLKIKGAGDIELSGLNTFSGDLVVDGFEGPITLRLNNYANLGDPNNTLSLNNVKLKIASTFGTMTRNVKLSGSLEADIARFASLTLNPAANPGIGQTLTKSGLGALTVNGLSISGDVDFQGGLMTLGSGVLALPGGQVTIADGLNLNVSGMVAKKVVGSATTTTLTAVGNTVIGGLGTENGYDYAGRILTGDKSVSLLRDGALSLGGAVLGNTFGGGTLSSANGIRLLPVTGPPNAINPKMIVGVGTVNGNIDLNGGRIRGTAAGDIKLTGIIGGSGIVANADLSQAVLWPSHTLLPSKGDSKGNVAGIDAAPGLMQLNIGGPSGGDLDNMVGGDYDQVLNAVYGSGPIDLSGTTLSLTRPGSYTPSTSTVFRLLNQAPASWGDEYNGWYKGFFSNVTDPLATPASFPAGQNWHWEFNWKNQAAYEFWDAYITTTSGPPPVGPVVPTTYVANNTLPLRAPLAKLISSQLPNPATLSYAGLDRAAMAEIAVFNPTYLDSELATGGMRGLLYEVAGGLFDTFVVDPAAGEHQGPFRLMMWRNDFWQLGAEGIMADQTYRLSNYVGAQDKFVIMWDDPSLAPNIREGSVSNPAAYNWLSKLTFTGGAGSVTLSVTPVPEPGTLVLLICGGLALLVWRRRRAG